MGASGLIERIDPFKFSPKEVQWLWDKVKTQDYALDDTVRADCRPFLHLLFQGEHWYNEAGLVSAVGITPKINCSLHFMIWDKSYSRHKILTAAQEVIGHLFETYELNRVTATIPNLNQGAIRLAVMLGMKFEGTMRESFLHNGQYLDAHIYGVLRREWDKLQQPKEESRGRTHTTEHELSQPASAG